MGRGSEYTFFQIRHTDGQQVHEKALNITKHQGKANQSHNEISPHIYQKGHHQKDKQWQVSFKDVEKKEPSCTIPRNVSWVQPQWTNSMEFPQTNRTTIWSSNSISGCLSKENENSNWKEYIHPMFIAAFLTIAKTVGAT